MSESKVDLKHWAMGFAVGIAIAVYMIILLVGPFVVGQITYNLTAGWGVWAWVLAGSAAFIWFMAFFMGFYLLIHTDDDKKDAE